MLLIFACCAMQAFAQLTITVTSTNASCYGVANGTATATVSGGSGNYTYQWGDPQNQTTPTAYNLSAGAYQLEINDGAGNDTIVFAVVQQPDMIHTHASVIGAKCTSNGSIQMNVTGGTPPYSYTWSHTGTTIYPPAINGLAAGTYTVVVTDANACTSDTSITVSDLDCEVRGEIAFTPNGDGIRDEWIIYHIEFFPNAFVTVFNRWGQKVFESEGEYQRWDGTHMGKPVPDAVYYYVIYRDRSDKEKGVETGSVTIVR